MATEIERLLVILEAKVDGYNRNVLNEGFTRSARFVKAGL